jgi:hypothetical protein
VRWLRKVPLYRSQSIRVEGVMSLIWSFSSLVEDPIGLRALLKAKDKARVERMIAKAEGLPTV